MNSPVSPSFSSLSIQSLRSDTTFATDTSVDTISPNSHIPYNRPWKFPNNELESEEAVFIKNGYKKVSKICNTLQGELFKAVIVDNRNGNNKPKYVAIKRTSKDLYQKKIAIEDGMNFCVSENIIKEAFILKHLTVDNSPIGNYIVKFVNFFESSTDMFLVSEYIDSETNLKQFVSKAHEYIQSGKLSLKLYHTIVKYLLWQLVVTIQYLHDSMHCCHLDLCLENVMLKHATFIHTTNGVEIDTKISVKLADFGVSEVFGAGVRSPKTNSFLCEKQGLSISNLGYFAPKVFFGEVYDARCADNFCLGMMFFQLMTVGKTLYTPLNMHSSMSGYSSLFKGTLRTYLRKHSLNTYLTNTATRLLLGLLNVNEQKRLKSIDVVKHKYFAMYFKRYEDQIRKKYVQQKQQREQQRHRMQRFPYYH